MLSKYASIKPTPNPKQSIRGFCHTIFKVIYYTRVNKSEIRGYEDSERESLSIDRYSMWFSLVTNFVLKWPIEGKQASFKRKKTCYHKALMLHAW